MMLRSARPLGSPAPPQSAGGTDRISALPDDLLLLVLARLRCVRTAARASVLSRRWRGLWTRLPDLVFRGVPPHSVAPVISRVLSSASASASTVSLLDIRLPARPFSVRATEPFVSVGSLLRAAARLSPERLVLAIPPSEDEFERVELPCFPRATSISLRSSVTLFPPVSGEIFPALTTLVLSGSACAAYGDDFAALILRCPSLRVLWYTLPAGYLVDISFRSASLRELFIVDTSHHWTWVRHFDVSAPMLEKLSLSSHVAGLSVSVLAPMATNISWHCHYNDMFMRLGDSHWIIETVSLLSMPRRTAAAAQRPRPPVLRIDASKEAKCSHFVWTQDHLAHAVEQCLKMQVAVDLSVFDLELHLTPFGHVYGAAAFFFLQVHRISTTIRRLKVAIAEPTDKKKCEECGGCEPADWTSQTVSLTKLEEVEIDGFQGDKREFDFLEHLLRCAPMLKKLIVRHSDEAASNEGKIHEFFMAHPFLECAPMCHVIMII